MAAYQAGFPAVFAALRADPAARELEPAALAAAGEAGEAVVQRAVAWIQASVLTDPANR